MEQPFYKIARNLNIATSTAHQVYKKFVLTGLVGAKKQRQRQEVRALNEHSELLVVALILENPTMYLDLS